MLNRFKRILAALLACTIFFSSLPLTAAAEEGDTSEQTSQSPETPSETPTSEPEDDQPAAQTEQESTALSAPVITVPEEIQAGQPLTVSWAAVENANGYFIEICDAEENRMADGWTEGTSYTFDCVLAAGSYTVVVYAQSETYDGSNASAAFAVTGQLPSAPTVSVDSGEIVLGSSLSFQVSAEGAQKLQARWKRESDSYYSTDSKDVSATTSAFQIYFSKSGTFTVQFAAFQNSAWSEWSEALTITVTSKGTLANPELTLPSSVTAGQDVTISWNPIENAERYSVELYREDGSYVDGFYPGTTASVTIPLVLDAGIYKVDVFSQAAGWESGETSASFTVSGELAAPPVLSLDASQYTPGDQITYTVQAEGAQNIRLRCYGMADEGYSYDDTFEIAASGTTTTYSKYFSTAGSFNAVCSVQVDGVWSAYCAPVPFEVNYAGELAQPVPEMKDSYSAGEEITVTWAAVENAEEYSISLYDQNETYLAGWWKTAPEASVTIDRALEAGSYYVTVSARADGWKSAVSAEKHFTVTGTLADGPSFAVDTTTVTTGKDVTFTVSMEGATSFRLLCDGSITEHAATDGAATFTRTLYGADKVVTAQISAFVNGAWTAYGPSQEITIQDKPTLGKTFAVVPSEIHAGEDITLSWEAVENAQRYYVSVDSASGEYVWGSSVTADSTQCVLPAGRVKQGTYFVSITAYTDGYHNSEETAVQMTVLAPLAGKEFRYSLSSDGTKAYLSEYLGVPVPETVEIPAAIGDAAVTNIYSKCLENDGTLKKVTIPASVTYIATDAFAGSETLTICGYSGSEAEEYAILNGYTFEALDDGNGDITASWTSPVLVNTEMTFVVSAAGATEVRMYEGGYKNYQNTVLLTDNGASVVWTPEESGTLCIRFEALVDGEWLTTKNYVLEVTDNGEMPKATGLTVSASVVEPGTAVTLSWTAPEGVEAAEYKAGLQSPGSTYITWFTVTAGDTSFTFSDYWLDEEGSYTLWVSVEAQPGYLPSTASCALEVKSTQTWDYLPSSKSVIAYHGTDKEIVIPAEINSQPVTNVGSEIFANSEITSVTVPEGITSIGYGAFSGSESLSSVSLPSTLTSINSSAFTGCAALSAIALPDSLRYLSSYAFSDCKALATVAIPAQITSISSGTFSGCSALAQVVLPDGLSSIGSNAFSSCTSLKAITIPQSVSSIDGSAFYGCTGLTIYGYSNSTAEAFAEAQGFAFVALDAAETGEISFTLDSTTVYTKGYAKITVTAPDAEMLRLHYNGQISQRNISAGSAVLRWQVSAAGTGTVTVSQCVDGKWMAPCEAKTITVVDLSKPVIEAIAATPAYTPVTVRWKSVTGAADYTLTLYRDNVQVGRYEDIQAVDDDGNVFQQLSAADVAHEGIYTLQVTAYAADEGYSYAERAFEVTDISDAFQYTVNDEGKAVLVSYTGGAAEVTVPAQLDGYDVAEIAAKAFMDTATVSVVLPATVTLVNTQAFYNCEALEKVTILDGQAMVNASAFAQCPKLMSIYLGTGVFAQAGAFDSCRTDAVVYGYSGGNVEEEALTSCKFSSLGALAAGPEITAEDIWKNESLTYTVSQGNASKLYVKEYYPDDSVNSYVKAANRVEETAEDYDFESITEDCTVIIRSAALINGAWTAYAEKTVTVAATKELQSPVIHEIGRLERHLDHEIRWDAVENAESYEVVIKKNGIFQKSETVTAPGSSITLAAGTLTDSADYTVTVTASAEGYTDSGAEAQFEVYSIKLDTPEIEVEARIARHLGATIRWEAVANAETYTIAVSMEGEDSPICEQQVEGTSLELTPEQLEEGSYTVTLTAHAPYCTDSETATAAFEIYQEQLAAPVVSAPENVVGGVSFRTSWQTVANAENYALEILDGDGKRISSVSLDSQKLTHTVLLESFLQEGELALVLTASADYYTDGVTKLTMNYKPLYTYEVVDGGAVITGYNGTYTEVWVPAQIGGYSVTAIGDGAFENNTAITKVYLPASVTSIGAAGFKNCTALAWIAGSGVTEIGEEAFYNCTSLTDIQFGKNDENVTAGKNAFYNTPIADDFDPDNLLDIEVTEIKSYDGSLFLGEVTYNEGITEIPERTHYNNLHLGKVNLPESLRSIGSEAFAQCPELNYVRLYDDVESIAEDAFENAPGVHFYIYTGDMDEVSYAEQYAIDHAIPYTKVFHYDPDAEEDTSLITEIYEEGVYGVAEKNQYGNTRLGTVYLPQTLEFIESKAFAQCGALHTVYLYDGVTSIASDAFEGSDGVQFVLYVEDMEETSYAEQYAAEHGIPCTKYEKPAEVRAEIDVGDGIAAPVTVNIDTPVHICVGDIPSDADRVTVFLDGEQIFSTSTDQVAGVGFTYTFRQFGEQQLTAEAYQDGTVVKYSWKKPVIVTGIRLKADRETAWTCETVNFTVEADPKMDAVHLYAEELLFGTVQLENGVGTFAYAFTKAGDRQITARTDSGLKSQVLTMPILCIAQLSKPVLEAESIQYAADGLVCAWDTTENTDGYVLRVLATNGAELLKRDIKDDGTARMSCTISAEEIGGEGTYYLYLMNYGYKYSQNESERISVLLTADNTPAFTMDKQSAMTGEDVTFSFCAFGATEVELWVDGEAIETIPLTNGRADFTRAFTQSGAREISIRALRDDGWTELSDVQILQINSRGKLDAVQVTAEPNQLLGNSITASWSAVENAEGYTVYFRNAEQETLYKLTTDQLTIRLPADTAKQSGSYYFLVVAYGAGYDQSEGSANVNILDHLPGPVILTPTENETCTDTAVTLTWQEVTGAESYLVSLARKTERTDANGQPIYEKVWTAPNEQVNVGSDLSYALTGLAYGGDYRAAVGTVVTLEDGSQRVGWTERLFSVRLPELTAELSTDTQEPYEKQQITLKATANHALTQAVLTDETGAAVEVISSSSEIVDGGRVFTFVVEEKKQGEKTYTVTVSGTEELAAVEPVAASLTVNWQDANAPVVEMVEMNPQSVWPGMNVTFTLTANAHTAMVKVFFVNGDQASWVATRRPAASEEGEPVTILDTRHFDADGDYKLKYVPVNEDDEEGKPYLFDCTILPKGKMPAPNVTNLAQGDIVPNAGYTVQWDSVSLGEGMFFGGYSVTVYSWDDATDWWTAMPGQYNVSTGDACSYTLPEMVAGEAYRIEVYTLSEGEIVPSVSLSGCTAIDFTYRTVPTFALTSVETDGILGHPVTVQWEAPVWNLDAALKPDGYTVCWYRQSNEGIPVKVHEQTLDADTLTASLPANKAMPGSYTVEVYAALDGVTGKAAGSNAFVIHTPTVKITDAFFVPMNTMEVTLTAKYGVTQVLIRLVGPDGNVIALNTAGGASAEYLVMPVPEDGAYSAALETAKDLTAGAGGKTDYTVEVYGFVDGQQINISTCQIKSAWVVNIGKGRIMEMTADGKRNNHWVYTNDSMTIQVTTNKLVTDIVLSDNGKPINVSAVKDDKQKATNTFTASVTITGEGLHKITAMNSAGTVTPESVNVYAVTPTEQKQWYCSSEEKIPIWRYPNEAAGGVATYMTAESDIIQLGTCGEYVLVQIDGKAMGFVHENVLKNQYVIIKPGVDSTIDLSQTLTFMVAWDSYPGATSYKVTLLIEIRNKQGEMETIPYEKTVEADSYSTQTTFISTLGIAGAIGDKPGFTNDTWPTTIQIEAYG